MSDTVKILRHIAELYANPTKNMSYDQAVDLYYEKLAAHFDKYATAFENYHTADVITAIDKCWRYDSDKTRPKLAKIEAFLNSDDKVERKVKKNSDVSYKIPEYEPEQLMRRDIELGRNRHLLSVYQRAVRYIAEELLMREIPGDQWQRLKYSDRCRLAWSKGLFNQLDNVLVMICRKYYGKDYQYSSENDLKAAAFSFPDTTKQVKALASHYQTDEARAARNDNGLSFENAFGY